MASSFIRTGFFINKDKMTTRDYLKKYKDLKIGDILSVRRYGRWTDGDVGATNGMNFKKEEPCEVTHIVASIYALRAGVTYAIVLKQDGILYGLSYEDLRYTKIGEKKTMSLFEPTKKPKLTFNFM